MSVLFSRFLRGESGNASLDWSVLMVTVITVAVLGVSLLSEDATAITDETAAAIDNIELDPS